MPGTPLGAQAERLDADRYSTLAFSSDLLSPDGSVPRGVAFAPDSPNHVPRAAGGPAALLSPAGSLQPPADSSLPLSPVKPGRPGAGPAAAVQVGFLSTYDTHKRLSRARGGKCRRLCAKRTATAK